MATRERTDYLRFNAFAIKDLIIRKLASDSSYTDQIYPGSNLAILIDIVSYLYQTLLYNVNSAASESMFSDTQIYENINRLCSFIGYHPAGMNPSYAVFSFSKNELFESLNNNGLNVTPSTNSSVFIPRYSYLDTGLTDAAGKPVYFSTTYDIKVDSGSDNVDIVLYNGRWRLYDTVFTYAGTDWEKFILNGLRSDASTGDYIANNCIHVYVSEPDGNGNYLNPKQYTVSNTGLFKSRNEFYNQNDTLDQNADTLIIPEIFKRDDPVFDLRLNETKTYEITFGNGRQGYKPKVGSLIYVFYLESNGPGIEFDIGDVNGELLQDFSSFRKTNDSGEVQNIYEMILGMNAVDAFSIFVTTGVPGVKNSSQCMSFAPEETVDQIRDFAPSWFRMGNRLVTQSDYEYYLKNSSAFRNTFADIRCQNNWEYMATFYKWLYEMGVRYKAKYPGDYRGTRRFLSQDNLLKTSRQYADPADANNIYIWFEPSTSMGITSSSDTSNMGALYSSWKQALLPIKDLTHEPFFVQAVHVGFFVCACPDDELTRDQIATDALFRTGSAGESYIEVTISDEVLYANATVAAQVVGIVRQFFDPNNFTIGQYVNFNDLQDMIFAISGVEKIRTVYKPNMDNYDNCTVRNGVCFASYTTDSILDVNSRRSCLDLEVSSAGRSLEPFQFPTLAHGNDSPVKVKIIKRSAISINTVQY